MTDNASYDKSMPSTQPVEIPVQSASETTGRIPYEAPAYTAYEPPAPKAAQHAKTGGAGKTFALGFAGALLACAIGLGGFVAYDQLAHPNGASPQATEAAATVLLGTSDSSVINAVEEGQSLSEAVAAKALPSVVAIYNYQNVSNYGYGYGYGAGGNAASSEPVAAGMGSGVVISEDGYIMTNYHVVEDAVKLTVTVDGEERDAEYVGGDSSSDIAVLKVKDTSGLVAADIGDSDNLVIGEWVMTVGAPLGLEQSVATGVVSATNRSTIMEDSQDYGYGYYYSSATPEYTYYPNMIQTDAVINPGNSGGALVDADGKLIGINSMLSSSSGNYAGVGFAIPVNYAIGIAEDIIAGKEPTHAALGVSISQVNAQVAQRYGLKVDHGAYVGEILDGSGASKSDLQVGDIITAINGKEVNSPTDVTLDVREHQPGDKVTVTVNRDGEEKKIEVELMSDASFGSTSDSSTQNQTPNNGNGYGNGYGQSPNGGISDEELMELLDMLGR